ncbi:MAG: PEGA domain-containing protein [Deltaproteobacteria bacterium]|nr:PEGA domain-containing protein [Deltaproteobacteria bacterium]
MTTSERTDHRLRRPPVLVAAAGLLTALAVAPPARADDQATARQLFDQGKALLEQGKFDAACPALEASVRLYPGSVGGWAKLAECHERQGKLATASREYVQAQGVAREAGDAERERMAGDKVAALEPRLSTLSIDRAGSLPAGVRVVLDGDERDAAALGQPVAVDGGEHRIEVSAPGYRSWATTVTVQPERDVVTVPVPALEKIAGEGAATPPAERPVAAKPATPPAGQPGPAAPAPPAKPDEGAGEPAAEPSRLPAYLLFGLAGASVAVGTGLGIHALDLKSDYEEQPAAETADAGEQATLLADVFFGVGLASGAAAVVVLLVTGSGDANAAGSAEPAQAGARPALVPVLGPAGGGLAGTWRF